MFILDKIFKKRGIEDSTQLDEAEQKTYDNWRKILSEGDITVEKIKEFCAQQLSIIENKFKELDNSPEKNQRLIISHNIYKALLDCIEKPKKDKEHLEKYLQELLT